MDNCKSCCPFKVIEDYRNLEKELSKDFEDYIKKWFDEHSYVESIYVVGRGVFCANGMFFHDGNVKCTVTLKGG